MDINHVVSFTMRQAENNFIGSIGAPKKFVVLYLFYFLVVMLPAEKREIVNASIAVHFTMVLKDWGIESILFNDDMMTHFCGIYVIHNCKYHLLTVFFSMFTFLNWPVFLGPQWNTIYINILYVWTQSCVWNIDSTILKFIRAMIKNGLIYNCRC